jgi:hypothetical protein
VGLSLETEKSVFLCFCKLPTSEDSLINLIMAGPGHKKNPMFAVRYGVIVWKYSI